MVEEVMVMKKCRRLVVQLGNRRPAAHGCESVDLLLDHWGSTGLKIRVSGTTGMLPEGAMRHTH